MKLILNVEGMKCEHCKARVEKALAALDGVKEVSVDFAKKTATVTLCDGAEVQVPKTLLSDTVTALGFSVTGISEKKNLFGR